MIDSEGGTLREFRIRVLCVIGVRAVDDLEVLCKARGAAMIERIIDGISEGAFSHEPSGGVEGVGKGSEARIQLGGIVHDS